MQPKGKLHNGVTVVRRLIYNKVNYDPGAHCIIDFLQNLGNVP